MNNDETSDAVIDRAETWLLQHDIKEVECLVADVAGIARGKILRTDCFISALKTGGLHLAGSLYAQDVLGGTVYTKPVSPLDPDVSLRVDVNTLRLVPWRELPTATILCDAYQHTGEPFEIASRQVLHRVIDALDADGYSATVAPELEFHVTEMHRDPMQPISPAEVRTGATEVGNQAYGIDMLRDHSAIFDDLYRYCDVLDIPVEVLTHEAGPAQFEINIDCGEPLKKADEVFMFKRAAREAALKHGKMITFMAKPLATEPGNAMHIHQSVTRKSDGGNVFATATGEDSEQLHHYIGGLQKYIPAVLLLFAPFVNSYRRFEPNQFAPVNTHWGHENRTVGLRIPHSDGNNRRVENRIVGADSNPYLAVAATLACGLLGLRRKLEPSREMLGDAYAAKSRNLPEHLLQALENMRRCKTLTEVFHPDFLSLYTELKYVEYQKSVSAITPWEREHLLHTV